MDKEKPEKPEKPDEGWEPARTVRIEKAAKDKPSFDLEED